MAISRKPASTANKVLGEKDVASLINQGGSIPKTAIEPEEPKPSPKKPKPSSILVRINPETVSEVDFVRAQRIGNITRNTWMLEAVNEKLERERKQAENDITKISRRYHSSKK